MEQSDEFSKSISNYWEQLEREVFSEFPEFRNLVSMRYFGKDNNSPLLGAEAQLNKENVIYQET